MSGDTAHLVRDDLRLGLDGRDLPGEELQADLPAKIDEDPPNEDPLRDNTVIVFTSDQGPDGPQLKFGDPLFRGNKGSIYEAGIRVPTIVRACGQDEARIWPSIELPEEAPEGEADDDYLASHIDLFRTLAEAAGNASLSSWGAVEGTSLFGDLDDDTIAPGAVPPSPRDCAVAQYGKGVALMARRGLRPGRDGGVCGAVFQHADGRTRATSTWLCDPETDDCNDKKCTILGKRCADLSKDPSERPRCHSNGDCDGVSCEELEGEDALVDCGGCFPAAWKLKATENVTSESLPLRRSGGLFDLTTNPEENEDFDFADGVPDAEAILTTMVDVVASWNPNEPDCSPIAQPAPSPTPTP